MRIAIGVYLTSYPEPDPMELKEVVVSSGAVIDGDWKDYRQRPGAGRPVQPPFGR